VLSYLTVEPRLFDFCLFLEEHLVAYLPLHATGQAVAVLTPTSSQTCNQDWIDREARYMAALSERFSLDAIANFNEIDADVYRRRINEYFSFSPNRFLIVRLATALLCAPRDYPIDFHSFMEAKYADEQFLYVRRARLDQDVTELCRTWSQDPVLRAVLDYEGFCIGDDLAYNIAAEVLKNVYHAFAQSTHD